MSLTETSTERDRHFTLQPKSVHSETPPVELQDVREQSSGRSSDAQLEESPVERNAVREQQKWNEPRVNAYRLFAIFYAFIGFGLSDASYGALLPSLEQYYNLTYTVVSLVFLAPFAGYTLAALFSDRIHMLSGQRGMAALAGLCRLASAIVLCLHPPYPVIVVALVFTGLGNGLYDGGYNAWLGDLRNMNEVLGLVHGCYGAGATVAPTIATSLIVTYHLPWYTYYYIMVGYTFFELVFGTWAFWGANAADFRAKSASGSSKETGRLREALKQRATWIMSLFLLAYTGSEVSLGGWIVTFMIRQRKAKQFASGLAATGFWLGITVGRVSLGFITPRLGERWAIAAYLVVCVALQLIFWLVPQFYVSAIAVAFLGFFLGPMFPSAVVALTKILPKRLHVSAVGFSSALGGGGAAILPFAVGAIAQAKGVAVLQPIILALMVVLLLLWLMLPRIPKHAHAD